MSSHRPNLLAISWPIFVEQALRMAIGTVDTFMVAHLSDKAVAALSVSHQVIIFFIVAFNFIGIGASVVLTHYLGANDMRGAESITRNAVAVNTWLGVLASLAVFAAAAPMLRLMQLPEDLFAYGLPFLTWMGGTLFLESMGMSISAVLRAHKFTRDAMYVAIGQNVLNVFGNCILLYGLWGAPQLGITGVAISGVVSRLVSTGVLWWLLQHRVGLRLRLRDFFSVDWPKIGRILRIGLPAAGENMCYWTAFMLVTTFIARMGGEALAVQTYALQIQRIVMLFSISIGLGTEILIGHRVGAGQIEEAYSELLHSLKTGLWLAFGGMALVALAGPWLIGIFSENPVVVSQVVLLLRIAIVLEVGRVFNVVVINSLRATGDVSFPIQMAALSMWCVWVPLAWLLGLQVGWGLVGIWIAMTIDEWLRGVLMYRRWKQRKWVESARRSREHVTAAGVVET